MNGLHKALVVMILSSLCLAGYAEDEGELPLVNPTPNNVIDPAASQENHPPASVPIYTIKGNSEPEQGDCKARLQTYLDRQACMNRYHVIVRPKDPSALPPGNAPQSGIRAEAFSKCGPDVAYPVDCPIQ